MADLSFESDLQAQADPGEASASFFSIFDTLIVVDAIGLSFWLAEWITLPELLLLHVGSALACLAYLALAHRGVPLQSGIDAALCVLSGPVGTIVLRIARTGLRASPAATTGPEDDDNGDDIRLSDAIYEAHHQGRRSVQPPAQAQSYVEMLRHGDLSRHNEVIAAISRNYEPEMYPALSLALGSNSPALKVQAAAVYSKLRRTFGETANSLLKVDLGNLTRDEAAAYHADFLRVARSGFVDAERGQMLLQRAEEIEARGLHAHGRLADQGPFARTLVQARPDVRKPGPRLKRYSCGGLG